MAKGCRSQKTRTCYSSWRPLQLLKTKFQFGDPRRLPFADFLQRVLDSSAYEFPCADFADLLKRFIRSNCVPLTPASEALASAGGVGRRFQRFAGEWRYEDSKVTVEPTRRESSYQLLAAYHILTGSRENSMSILQTTNTNLGDPTTAKIVYAGACTRGAPRSTRANAAASSCWLRSPNATPS